MPTLRNCVAVASVILALACGRLTVQASDWPAFRGPTGTGVTPDKAPTNWSPEQGVVWKVKLPRPANGSPIVSKNSVFVTSAEDAEGKHRSLYCFDRSKGELRWVRTVDFDKVMPTHDTNPYAGSTPAADGERVVVWHASAGLHCYDFAGQLLWSRDLGEYRHMWGYGTSPVLLGDRVLLHTGPGKQVFVMGLDLATGKTLWQAEEKLQGEGDYNENKKYMGSWCTPVITQVNAQTQLVCTLPTRVVAYAPEDGRILWSCDGIRGPKGDLAYSSPIFVKDVCFVTGGFNGPGMAVRLGGEGNVTDSHRLWRVEQNPQSIGSGVAVDGYVYRPNAGPGTIECLDPMTGKILWTERARGKNYWASIISAGGLLYALNQDGETVVFRPHPEKFDEVSVNPLGEASNATPAVSDGQIFFRTSDHLFCIGG